MKKLAIVGTFYDGYYDLWEDFLELFELNWRDCPYPLYIVNNEKDLNYDKDYNVSVIHAGREAEYSRKVQKAIECIDADYYLFLLDDFFFSKKLDRNILEPIMKYIVENDCKYYRLPLGEFESSKHSGEVVNISPNDEYTLSCQPSIWEKGFLTKCIGDENYNAWIFEGIYCMSKKAHTPEFLRGCVADNRNILSLRHGALQGKMLYSTYSDFVNSGYTFKNTREILSRKYEMKHKFIILLKQICPLFLQKKIKKNVKTNSVTERYSKEIQELIIKMNL